MSKDKPSKENAPRGALVAITRSFTDARTPAKCGWAGCGAATEFDEGAGPHLPRGWGALIVTKFWVIEPMAADINRWLCPAHVDRLKRLLTEAGFFRAEVE